jgi:aminoglycoside phosphotransferase family enzyme/predicted kinase
LAKGARALCYIDIMAGAEIDQAEVLDFLAVPESYDRVHAPVDRIATHASVVFLAGDRAYKVKRAVKYPFLDFSTLARRHDACVNELVINRRTAPQLYLQVVPVTLEADGKLRLDGEGRPVEWVVVMRRFDQADLFDRMAEEGRLPLTLIPRLATAIAVFHRSANRVLTPKQSLAALREVARDNEDTLAAQQGVIDAEAVAEVGRLTRAAFDTLAPLLEARALGGYVRHCHGDLHLRNIVAIDGEPVLFDAIEFDDAIATIDVLYDLAFLLMDLGTRGLAAHANALLNAYLEATGDTGTLLGLKTLPLFLSLRAMVRAKVELLRAGFATNDAKAEARRWAVSYIAQARGYLAPEQPRLVAIGGLSGSGKSSVARVLAPQLGAFPGAMHVRSDRERKRLFHVGAEERLPKTAYRAELSDLVYRLCRKRALEALAGGQAVIVDAVHAKPAERKAIAAFAARAGVPFTGIWLEAPPEIMRERIKGRTADVSDATAAVLEQQLEYDLGPQDFTVVDAGRPVDDVAADCLRLIQARFMAMDVPQPEVTVAPAGIHN